MPAPAIATAAREATLDRLERDAFDCVVIFSGLYNMVLPRARRLSMLRAAPEELRPGGRVLLTYNSAYVPPRELDPAPQSGGFWSAVNAEHETGDEFLLNEVVHVFPRAEDLAREVLIAGLEVEALERDQRAYDRAGGRVRGYAILRRPL